MAEDTSSALTSKVKFGFVKKTETKIQATSTNGAINSESVEVKTSVEFITTVEDLKIISENGVSDAEMGELVIPLIHSRRLASKSRVLKQEIVLSTEDAAAAAEILKDVEKLQGAVEDGSDVCPEIPLWMQNGLSQDQGYSENGKLVTDGHAEEPTLDDYEQTPVEKYGMAMLRGMGWKADVGIGKTNRKVTQAMEVNIRPRGLGLGATPAKQKEKDMKKEATEKAEKKISIGAFVQVTQGREVGRVGQVIDADLSSERWTVKLVGEKNRSVHLLEVNLKIITEKEHKKAGIYLNQDEYSQQKVVQDEKLQRIREDVKRDERERGRRKEKEERIKTETNSDEEEKPAWEERIERRRDEKPHRTRESREERRERKRRHSEDRSDRRRKRSRSRSDTPERRRKN